MGIATKKILHLTRLKVSNGHVQLFSTFFFRLLSTNDRGDLHVLGLGQQSAAEISPMSVGRRPAPDEPLQRTCEHVTQDPIEVSQNFIRTRMLDSKSHHLDDAIFASIACVATCLRGRKHCCRDAQDTKLPASCTPCWSKDNAAGELLQVPSPADHTTKRTVTLPPHWQNASPDKRQH